MYPPKPQLPAGAARGSLARLRAFLRARGVPVGPVVVADGRLLIRIPLGSVPGGPAAADAGPGGPLGFDVVLGPPPPREGPAPFRTVAGFALGYDGVAALDELPRAWLELIAALLTRSADRLPALLATPGAAGTEALPLSEALPLEFPFCTLDLGDDGAAGGRRLELLVRTTTRCNQACPFCSAPPPLADPPLSAIRGLLDRIFAAPLPGLVTLTGGEPTLRADLADMVQYALSGPPSLAVHVQTNAVFFHRPERVASFPARPRLRFFVSLHAVDEALYDACTATRGQLPRALDGVRHLLGAGHVVILNCVCHQTNVDHLEEWVESIPRLFPQGRPGPRLHFSVTMCPEHRPGAPPLLVPYRTLAPKLAAAVRRADALGLAHDSLQGSTHASIPACLTPPDLRQDPTFRPRRGDQETGYEDPSRPWVKAARCRSCRVDPWCLGLPRPYVARFGLDELAPLP